MIKSAHLPYFKPFRKDILDKYFAYFGLILIFLLNMLSLGEFRIFKPKIETNSFFSQNTKFPFEEKSTFWEENNLRLTKIRNKNKICLKFNSIYCNK